jgi:hypothetical protein
MGINYFRIFIWEAEQGDRAGIDGENRFGRKNGGACPRISAASLRAALRPGHASGETV